MVLVEAVEEAVEQAQQYIREQKVVHSDETSFRQGNRDGLNPKQTTGWLWMVSMVMIG